MNLCSSASLTKMSSIRGSGYSFVSSRGFTYIRTVPLIPAGKHHLSAPKMLDCEPFGHAFSPGTCWTFRAGKSCSGCSYGHICYNCGAKHPASNCTSSGNQQRNRTSKQGPFGLLNSAEPDKVDRLYFLLQGYQFHLATYLVNGFR